MSKICPVCRRRFDPVGRQKYHDLNCKQRAYRARQRAKPKRKACAHCGCMFPVTKTNQLYHSPKCAKAADNSRQRLRKMAEAAAKEILRQQKIEAGNAVDLAVAAEKIVTPTNLPKVSIRQADDAEAALRQAIADREGAERAAVVRNEQPAFDIAEFSIRDHAIAQQKAEQQSPQGQGPSLDVLLKIKASQDGG